MHEGYQNYQDPRLQPPDTGGPQCDDCRFCRELGEIPVCVREVALARTDEELLRADVFEIVPEYQPTDCFEAVRWGR